MLGQAAAMLVALSTFVTLEITTCRLLAILDQVLSLTCSSDSVLVELGLLVFVHLVILVVVNRTLSPIHLSSRCHANSVTQQARWRGW